jgi:hypothetical protein
VSDWLTRYAAALGERLDNRDSELGVSEGVSTELLALARAIAEGTGDKRNAPLSSYLVGRYALARESEGLEAASAVEEASKAANDLLRGDET